MEYNKIFVANQYILWTLTFIYVIIYCLAFVFVPQSAQPVKLPCDVNNTRMVAMCNPIHGGPDVFHFGDIVLYCVFGIASVLLVYSSLRPAPITLHVLLLDLIFAFIVWLIPSFAVVEYSNFTSEPIHFIWFTTLLIPILIVCIVMRLIIIGVYMMFRSKYEAVKEEDSPEPEDKI